MNRVGDDLLLESLQRQEDYIHTAANAIDVKAGLVLAAGAFLAVQPAVLLIVPNIPKFAFVVQMLSFLILFVAAFMAHRALRITKYPSPGFDEAWRDEQIAARAETATEEDVRNTMLWGLVDQAKGRVAIGRERNDSKLDHLAYARNLTTISFLINFLIVAVVLATRFA